MTVLRGGLLAGVLLCVVTSASAQGQVSAEADPGVRFTRLIDRAEIRVSRIEIQAGATRRVHTHTDVEYHLFVPLEGALRITVGRAAPVAANPGQATFMVRGTEHGFTNVGTTAGVALEIFVKQSTATAQASPETLAAELMAALADASQAYPR